MKLSVFYEHIAEAAKQENKSIPELLSIVSNLGIEAVDIESWRLANDPLLSDKLDAAKLKVASVYQFFDFGHTANEEEIHHFIDLADSLGAKIVLCIPGFFSELEDNTQVVLDRMTAALTKMCLYAKEKGITVTLEDFDSNKAPYSTDDGLCWFLDRIDLLRCTFDTGNFLYSEIDELDAYEKLKPKIAHVHLKDRSLLPSSESFTTTIAGRNLYPSPVGSGCIKITDCIDRIKKQGYDGYFSIEHFGAKNQLTYIKRSVEFLKGLKGFEAF